MLPTFESRFRIVVAGCSKTQIMISCARRTAYLMKHGVNVESLHIGIERKIHGYPTRAMNVPESNPPALGSSAS